MTTLEQPLKIKKPFMPKTMEMKFVKLGMVVPLFFSALIAYGLVKVIVLGFMMLVH